MRTVHPPGERTGPSTARRLEVLLRGVERSRAARQDPQVLRAAGIKVERMAAEKMRAVAGQDQAWQRTAWGYRDMIGELRFALQYRARAMSRVRFFIAEILDDDDDPVPVSLRHETEDGKPTERAQQVTVDEDLCAAAEAELDRLPLQAGYSFFGLWSENFDVAGEAWLHGRQLDAEEEEWRIRSVLEVDTQGSDVTLKDELGQPRRVDLSDPARGYEGTEELYRLWVPHPAYSHRADSALNAMADVLEEIVLIGRERRAASQSRAATNGVWPIPEGVAQVPNTLDEDETPAERTNRFITDLTAALLAPIMNEGEPGAAAPIILTASREDIEVMSKSFIRFDRQTPKETIELLQSDLGRMATGLDIPPEILTGFADVNHWTAWQIDAATFRHYLEPSLRLMVDSLTMAFLRVALIARGFAPNLVRKLRIWYDASKITENPNRRQDALDARQAAAIGDAPFRAALGFSESDAPTPEERILMIAAQGGIDPGTAAAILAAWARREGEPDLLTAPAAPQAIEPARRQPQHPVQADAPGGTGTPDTAPPGLAAAATPRQTQSTMDAQPGHHLDTTTAKTLTDAERNLRNELRAATHQALHRALQRAGNRLRSKTTAQPNLHHQLRNHPTTTWAATLGQTQTLALGADLHYLLNQAWDQLKNTFTQRITNTIHTLATHLANRLLRGQPGAADRITHDMTSRIPAAWNTYRAALDKLAEQHLYGQIEQDETGELDDYDIPQALVRDALATIAGRPETSAGPGDRTQPEPSLTTGIAVTRELSAAGVETLGYLWVYGITPRQRAYKPHLDLEGTRFASWLDPALATAPADQWLGDHYHPGDHAGCGCDYVPAYAVPAYSQQVRDRLSVPTRATQDILNLAAADDRAGRQGTTAQEIRDQHASIQLLQQRFLAGG